MIIITKQVWGQRPHQIPVVKEAIWMHFFLKPANVWSINNNIFQI